MRSRTVLHEAAHVAAAILLGRPVDHALIEPGHAWDGDQLGHARIPIDEIEPSQIVICLIGYLAADAAGWPPTYEEALEEDREALGLVLLLLGPDKAAYEASIALTRRMLADPTFIRLRDTIARALSAATRLERDDIETLAAIHRRPDKEQSSCST